MSEKYRVINLYRSFNPTNGLGQAQAFINQLCIVENCAANLQDRKLIVMGDFNLDEKSKYNINYRHHQLYSEIE